MKKIKIFVASSIISFSSERKRMGAFFCEWNNRLIDKSVFLDVKFCEELDNAFTEKRKQDEYNSYIENSDLFIMLIDSDCGNYTMEEFQVACNSKKYPKILVFCRKSEVSLSNNVNQVKSIMKDRGIFFRYSNYKEQVEGYLQSYIDCFIDEYSVCDEMDISLKKITFFFGTADIQYEDERNEILRFVLGLNEKMLEKGIYIQAEPNAVTDASNQAVLSEKHRLLLDKSESAFFLFFSKIDKLLKMDFQYAIDKFREKSYPKIFTYFFNRISVDSKEIQELKKYIDCNMKHYYSEFSNVDSIKLSILIQIADKQIPGFKIFVDNGYINDEIRQQELLNIRGLSVFSENDILVGLKGKLENLTQQYEIVAAEFANDYRRRDLIVKLSELDDAISELTKKIHKEENATLMMLIEMHRSIVKGETKQLVKKAYHYLEAGKIKEASKILNKEVADAIYGKCLDSQIVGLQQEILDAIQMYKHSIHIQKMLEETEETISKIISCYEEIMKYLEFLKNVDIDIVLDYAEYLDGLGKKDVEEILKKAEYMINNPERSVDIKTKARLYDLVGVYYLKQYDPYMAEKYLKIYLDIMKKLYYSNDFLYAIKYAEACRKYCRVGVKLEKSVYMEKGLSVLKKVCKENPKLVNYQLELARYYYNRGMYYHDYDLQKESYICAKEILERYDLSDLLLADVYNNLAELIKENDTEFLSGSIVGYYYDLAIGIAKKGYSTLPDKYAEALGDYYHNKAVFLHYKNNYYQAIQTFKESQKIYLYLYKKNPVRGGLGLAESYIQMGNAYDSLGNSKKAIFYCEKGISLLEELIELNRERYVMKLAWGYSEIGQLYVLLDAKKKISGIATAMQYFGKCIKVLEETENDFIQHNQGNFVIEMLAAISLAIKNNTQEIESIFSITNCIYKFLYKYVWPDIKIGSQFIDIMFSLGCKILNYYESKEDEDMMEFYYPVMREIGKRLLLDETLTTDERLYIEDYLTKLKK